jgi:anthranilate/para-aminobenzoate synthase component II
LYSPVPVRRTKPASGSKPIEKAATTLPILGVRLGHQAIGPKPSGGRVVRAPVPIPRCLEIHQGEGVFHGINGAPFKATRYHSLVVEIAPSRPT